jgi:hypothetical protein
VRIECEHDDAAGTARVLAAAAHEGLVPDVNAIEVADGERGASAERWLASGGCRVGIDAWHQAGTVAVGAAVRIYDRSTRQSCGPGVALVNASRPASRSLARSPH